jgi:hypothetical protein
MFLNIIYLLINFILFVLTPLPEDFAEAKGQVRSTTEFSMSDFAVASYVSVGLHGRVSASANCLVKFFYCT